MTADREIVITRQIDAPRAKVWEAFTTAEHLAKWWGPNGFTITTSSFDFREGGVWKFVMHGPDGRDYPNDIMFTKIVEHERMDHNHGGDDGTVHFHAMITLSDKDGGTEIVMRSVFPSKEERDFVVKEYKAIEGGTQTIARLAEYVSKL
jgi:uncharacterized protein YndB with AHSA1/START domain